MRSVGRVAFGAACLAVAGLPASPATALPTSCTIVSPQTSCTTGYDCWPHISMLSVEAEVLFGVGTVTGSAICDPDSVSCTAVTLVPCSATGPITPVWGAIFKCAAAPSSFTGAPIGWRVTCMGS